MFDGNHVSDMLWNQNFNFADLVSFDAKLFSSSKDLRALHDQFIKKLISACGIESSKRVNCYMLQPSLNRCRPKQPGLKKSLYPHRWQGAGMPDCFSWKSGLLSHFWYIYWKVWFLRAEAGALQSLDFPSQRGLATTSIALAWASHLCRFQNMGR